MIATPAAVDFGTVAPGAASAPQAVTFSNPFYSPTPPSVRFDLATPPVVISGADAGDFSVTSDCGTGLDAQCTAQVTLNPTATGRRDAVVELVNNVGTVISAATLTGKAVAPRTVITSAQSGFGNPTVGVATTGVVTFTNGASVAIPMGTVFITGSANFTLPTNGVDTCSGVSLPPGGSCGVQVQFMTSLAGGSTATVAITSSGLSAPAEGAVAVTAAAPTPTVPFVTGNVPICHGKHLQAIAPNYRGVLNGHSKNNPGHRNDVIPPFRYPGGVFPGKNWPPTGAAASNQCVLDLIAWSTPATSAQLRPPNPPVQSTVTLCHATGASTWSRTSVPADQAYGLHARHGQDIIPPFSIRTASGAVAFPGQNWDSAGQAILRNQCRDVSITSSLAPAENVILCSAPQDGQYALISRSPSAALTYARMNPTAIVPPFRYRSGTTTRLFQGLNWSSRGQQIFAKGCVDPDPPLQRITPSVQCVQVAADGTLTAYFNVSNPNGSTTTVAPGAANQVTGTGLPPVSPPGAFAPGDGPRVLTVPGIPASGSATWSVTAGGATVTAVASGLSPACAVPPDPPKKIGVFASCIRAEGSSYTVVFGYENSGTAPVTIPVGPDTNRVWFVPRLTATPDDLGQTTTFEPGRHAAAFQVQGLPRGALMTWGVRVASGTTSAAFRGAIVSVPDGAPACVTTPPTSTTVPPTTGPQPPDVTPLQPPAVTSLIPIGVQVTCVRNNGNGGFDAIFGYTNANPVAITTAVGDRNRVTPSLGGTGADQGQVTTFQPGSIDNAWVARGVPVSQVVTWKVGEGGGASASAGVNSPACPGATTATPTKPPSGPLVPPALTPVKADFSVGVFVQCVRRTGRTYTASFGYEMKGPGPVAIALGKNNRVGPSAFNGQQPVMFTPGRHEAVFTVEKIPLRRSATWTVRGPDGITATATSRASGPNCIVSRQPVVPALEVSVPPATGATITGRPQPQPIVVRNTGTATATGVVAVVPPASGQVIRPTASTGTPGARCSRTSGKGVIRVADLLPGQSARCVLAVTSARCDALATTVRASASSLRLTGAIQSRVGGVGGRSSCRAAGSGVTG